MSRICWSKLVWQSSKSIHRFFFKMCFHFQNVFVSVFFSFSNQSLLKYLVLCKYFFKTCACKEFQHMYILCKTYCSFGFCISSLCNLLLKLLLSQRLIVHLSHSQMVHISHHLLLFLSLHHLNLGFMQKSMKMWQSYAQVLSWLEFQIEGDQTVNFFFLHNNIWFYSHHYNLLLTLKDPEIWPVKIRKSWVGKSTQHLCR